MSADHQTLTFTLRPGVKFSDGKPLVAADVVFSINRARTNDGPAELPRLRDQTIDAQGTNNVVFKLARRGRRSCRTSRCSPTRSCRRTSAARPRRRSSTTPIGTGPFTLSAFTPDASIADAEAQPALLAGGQAVPRRGRVPLRRRRQPARAADRRRPGAHHRHGAARQRRVARGSSGLNVEPLPGLAGRPAGLEREAAAVRRPPRAPRDHLRDQPAGAGARGELRHRASPAVRSSRRASSTTRPSTPVLAYSLAEAKAELAKSKYPKGFATKLLIAGGVQKWHDVRPDHPERNWRRSASRSTITPLDHAAFETTFQKFDYDMFIDYAINDISDPDEMASFELDFKNGGSQSYWSQLQQPDGHHARAPGRGRVRQRQAGRALRADPDDRRRGRAVRRRSTTRPTSTPSRSRSTASRSTRAARTGSRTSG